MKSTYNYGISLVRALSILYIVGYWHLFNYTSAFRAYYNPFTHHLTRIVLASFVFVSGYLIAGKNLEFNWKDILDFWRKRLIRIYPLYLLALLIFYFSKIADGWTLAKAALLISMFFPPSPPTLWFITMIVLFYILAPILIKYVNNLGLFLSLNALIILLFFWWGGSWQLLLFFPSFSLGIWLKNHDRAFNYLQKQQLFLTIVFLVLFLLQISNKFGEFQNGFVILHVLLINIGAILFYFYSSQIMKRCKFVGVIEALSYASFCMYLFHRPIFSLTKYIFFPSNEQGQVLYLVGVALPLTIIIGWLAQKSYDTVINLVTKQQSGGNRPAKS